MNENYNEIKKNELKNTHSDFSIAEEMQTASRNEMWRNKYGLWAFLSGACDDAAQKCYEHINGLAESLIDVDTCNVHSLKSIAESVDLSYLCKNIKEDFPFDIAELIDLFSVPKHLLLTSNRLLHPETNATLEGNIVERSAQLIDENTKYSIDLLYEIKKHIYDIQNILNSNLVFTKRQIGELVSNEFKENLKKKLPEGYGAASLLKRYFNEAIDEIANIDFQMLKDYQQNLIVDGNLNAFYALINVCKNNLINKEYGFALIPVYLNEKENIEVDLTALFSNIINSFESFDERYVKDFICYHFYNTIVSKIKNDRLGSYFSMITSEKEITKNRKEKNYHFIINDRGENEFSEEELEERLLEFLTYDEMNNFIFQKYPRIDIHNEKDSYDIDDKTFNSTLDEFKVKINQNMNKVILDFVQYVKFINSFIGKYASYIKENFNGMIDESNCKIDYDILKINFSDYAPYQKMIVSGDVSHINNYDDILFGTENAEGVIMKLAKELTDIAINISHIREQIKVSIQQYSFIGTKRIATDILRDFFIKNYSNKDEWNYISDLMLQEGVDVSSLFKPLSTLLDSEKLFSIDVVEYYDDTKYLNIESDLPEIKIGTNIKGYEQRPTWWVDDNNLITSGLVSAAVYEDVYAPCSVYISDYNKKFWNTGAVPITLSGEENKNVFTNATVDDFEQMFKYNFDEFNSLRNDNEKKAFISGTLYPLFEKIWDTFALSALSENPESLGEIANVYKKYSGVNEPDAYENFHNSIFPTIAPLVNIDGLIEVTSYASDMLFVAKEYYSNIMQYVVLATKNMLKMHDKNGVPYESWRQHYINFHGYSTNYEYADNMSIFENDSMKIFKFDGPFSYSELQKIIYETLLNKENAEYKVSQKTIVGLTKYIDVSDDVKDAFVNAYNAYFNNSEMVQRQLAFNTGQFETNDIIVNYPAYFMPTSDDFIGNQHIVKIEKDQYEDTFTLFKKADKVDGVLFYRSQDMLISLPVMQTMLTFNSEDFFVNSNFSTDATIEVIRKMANGCVDFGVIGNLMWMFSKISDNLNAGNKIYKFISFKFKEDERHLIVDKDSIRFYSNSTSDLDNRIVYLNDYVGSVYEPNKEYVDFLFSDWEEIVKATADKRDEIEGNNDFQNQSGIEHEKEIVDLSDEYLFKDVTIPLYRMRLHILENKCEMSKITVKKCAMPMLIDHMKASDALPGVGDNVYRDRMFDETPHRIWQTNKYEDKCLVCYEALNKNFQNDEFFYYFGFGKMEFKYQVLEICFNNQNYYTNARYNDKNELEFSNTISFTLHTESALVKNDAIFDKVLNLCYEYPKCIIQNGNLVIKILPFALMSYGNKDKQLLFAKSIAKNICRIRFNNINKVDKETVTIKFDDVLGGFSDYFFMAEAETPIKKASYESLQFIHTLIEDEDNELHITPLKELINSDNENTEKESVLITPSFEQANVLIQNIPFVINCMTEKLKIVVMFKNDTGITFIDDRAVDLDLTCYIDDPFEKEKKVGYWNKYLKTRYIEWSGDNAGVEHEELLVDVNKYLKEKRKINDDPLKINLNLCWHDTSQIKTQDVYVILNWQNIVETIPINILGEVNKDCNTRSLSIMIHPNKNNTLTYELPKWYPVIKVAYKDEIVGYEDGIPDIQLGFINLVSDELKQYQNDWVSVYDENGDVRLSSFKHSIDSFKYYDKNVDFVSYLVNKPLSTDINVVGIKKLILSILSEYFSINSMRLNLVTKERFYTVPYSRLCLEDMFFGINAHNEDPETGVDMIYYGFLNPTFFKDDETKNNFVYPIEAAMLDHGMYHYAGYDGYYNDSTIVGFEMLVAYALRCGKIFTEEDVNANAQYMQSNNIKLYLKQNESALFDEYVTSEHFSRYTVVGFLLFAWEKVSGEDQEQVQIDHKDDLNEYLLTNLSNYFENN